MPDAFELDAKSVENFRDADFADWLATSLTKYFFESATSNAFRPFHSHFLFDLSLTQDFINLFQTLSPDSKTLFRWGVAIALRKTQIIGRYYPILSVLLEVAAGTGATTVLEVISAQLREHPADETYLEMSWIAIASLAINAGESSVTKTGIECLQQVSRSPVLEAESAVAPFILLCKLRPNDIPGNLAIFRHHLDVLYDWVEDTVEEDKREQRRRELLTRVRQVSNAQSLFSSIAHKKNAAVNRFGLDWWQSATSRPDNFMRDLCRDLGEPVPAPATRPIGEERALTEMLIESLSFIPRANLAYLRLFAGA